MEAPLLLIVQGYVQILLMCCVVFKNAIYYKFPDAKQISPLRGTTLYELSFKLLEGDLMKEYGCKSTSTSGSHPLDVPTL